MARVNVDILGISELKGTGMSEFNSDDYYIYYCGQESLKKWSSHHGQKSPKCRCNLKNDRMISVCLQCKPFKYQHNPSLCPNH